VLDRYNRIKKFNALDFALTLKADYAEAKQNYS
jgi:hypothetical protein